MFFIVKIKFYSCYFSILSNIIEIKTLTRSYFSIITQKIQTDVRVLLAIFSVSAYSIKCSK